ncbi:MAG TPA: hypothetical protein VFT60_13585 [Bryobacteraceae bacterium]|jgi:hypothetical protein|nr:hypothetical protein [Bryobacteraceae bacterium]
MRFLAAWLAFAALIPAAAAANKVSYVGGTIAGVPGHSHAEIDVAGSAALSLHLENKAISIDWDDVTTVEYGLRVDRRYIAAVLISPLFLMAKKKSHFITIGFTDDGGQHQAVVLEVGKHDVRQLLVSLEAKSGRRIEYQDDEARKAGKG